MLPAWELSIGTRPHCARPTSTASKTVRIDGYGWCSAPGKSACAPSSEYAPGSPWYATTATSQSLGGGRLRLLLFPALIDVLLRIAERGEEAEERRDPDRQHTHHAVDGRDVAGRAHDPAPE